MTLIVYTNKKKLKIDCPFPTEFSILDISKNCVFMAWHDLVQPALGIENVTAVLTVKTELYYNNQNLSLVRF